MKRIILFVSIMLSLASFAEAQINVSVQPLEGGGTLRFGRLRSRQTASKEVRLRITATEGQQYQVYHRVLDHFASDKGGFLNDDVMSAYTISGSNSYGTLYGQQRERLSYSDTLLYSSAQSGSADAFTVVYDIDPQKVNQTGNFLGRIQYIVRPLGGGSQGTAILNVTFDNAGDIKFKIEAARGGDLIRLNSTDAGHLDNQLKVSFSGLVGNDVKVYQEMVQRPMNDRADEVDAGLIVFQMSGSSKKALYPGLDNKLSRNRVLVYDAELDEDIFYIDFYLDENKLEAQKAGIYRGQLRYTVESDAFKRDYLINIEVEIDPVFSIEVDLPPGGMSFDKMLPNSAPIIREVTIRVDSNLGRPFVVTQNVSTPLTNREGEVVPEEYFTIKTDPLKDVRGELNFEQFSPVSVGDKKVYISDRLGSSCSFRVLYRLKSFATISAGDYSTVIRYSLGEL